jgi:hypothetical protein
VQQPEPNSHLSIWPTPDHEAPPADCQATQNISLTACTHSSFKHQLPTALRSHCKAHDDEFSIGLHSGGKEQKQLTSCTKSKKRPSCLIPRLDMLSLGQVQWQLCMPHTQPTKLEVPPWCTISPDPLELQAL